MAVRKILSASQQGIGLDEWQGFKKEENDRLRSTVEYKQWMSLISKRDGRKCMQCGRKKRVELQIHHILPRRERPDLTLDINNGITLCKLCHAATFRKEVVMADFFVSLLNSKNNMEAGNVCN